MNHKHAVVAVLLAGLAVWCSAQSVDESLKTQMAATGLKYEVTKLGNVKVLLTEPGGRTQVVFLGGSSSSLDNLELREIWSVAGTWDGDPDQQTLLDLLSEGGNEALGAWNLEQRDEGWLVYYSAKLPVDIAATDLRSAMGSLAAVADRKEKDLFDSDDN